MRGSTISVPPVWGAPGTRLQICTAPATATFAFAVNLTQACQVDPPSAFLFHRCGGDFSFGKTKEKWGPHSPSPPVGGYFASNKELILMSSHAQQAQTQVEALPYIQKFTGKTIVVKYGGNAMISDELRKAVMSDIILLSLVGIRVVMVHGGGPEISDMLKKIGHESKFVDGLRYTDQTTMDVVQSILCGKVNKNLVAQINRLGGQAIGLCGMDGQLFQAECLDEKYGLVGKITGVNPEPVENALETHYIPVVSTVAQGMDADTAYNINADTAAAKLAEALNAEKLILLTDVRGLLRDPHDEETLIHEVRTAEVSGLIADGIISGGMIPKMQCCVDAIEGGVERVHILDGRIPHSILIELLSDRGIGTMLKQEEH